MGWEKIFENDVTDKGLVSKVYEKFIQLINQKNKKPNSLTENGQKT